MPESLRYDCLYGVALPYTFTLFVYMMRFIHMMRIFYTVMLAFTFATLMRESPVKPSSILGYSKMIDKWCKTRAQSLWNYRKSFEAK